MFEASTDPGPADAATTRWFVLRGDELLVPEDPCAPRWSAPAGLPREGEAIPLGSLDGHPAWAAIVTDGCEAPAGARFSGLRPLHARLDGASLEAASLAVQLAYFAKNYRYCARCAGALRPAKGTRARLCAGCGHEWYPRVSPCAIVLVHDGDRVLLTRSPRHPPGMYALVAGFVEASESLERCAEREVLEEVGVRVRGLRYFGSQPWSFPHQLMVGFTAEYAGGDVVVDRGELEDARWFQRDALPLLPPPISIARKLLDAWINGAVTSP